MMNNVSWIFLGIGAVAILVFTARLRRLLRKLKQQQKEIDYTKLQAWQEED